MSAGSMVLTDDPDSPYGFCETNLRRGARTVDLPRALARTHYLPMGGSS